MGPLKGLKVLEFGSIGPGPFAAMVLANLGADVIRLRRPNERTPITIPGSGADQYGRPAVNVDLKSEAGRALARELAAKADAIVEGFRPGVMERLGLGPDVLAADNPRLVYARITGYGQHGPMSGAAGHDINYIAMSGVLSAISRRDERPLFPMNLLGDYGGGGMLVALGILSAVFEARNSGQGQVVDASMVEGAAQLATIIYSFADAGAWGPAGTNVLDSGAPFYEVYETSDGGFMAVGAIEPQFYAELLRVLGIDAADAPQGDPSRWPELKKLFADAFAARTREEWTALFDGTDACVTPVLSMHEAPLHPHNSARQSFTRRGERLVPAAAPHFDRTPADDQRAVPGQRETLLSWGLSDERVAEIGMAGAF